MSWLTCHPGTKKTSALCAQEMKTAIFSDHFFEKRAQALFCDGVIISARASIQRYRRGQGSNPSKPEFFQAFFWQLHKLHLSME